LPFREDCILKDSSEKFHRKKHTDVDYHQIYTTEQLVLLNKNLIMMNKTIGGYLLDGYLTDVGRSEM